MGDGDPAFSADFPQPILIRTVRCEVVRMTLYRQATLTQDDGKFLTQVSVGEEDPALPHAARS